jgi:hypothetical protein
VQKQRNACPLFEQALAVLAVDLATLALAIRRVRPADVWALRPSSSPSQRSDSRIAASDSGVLRVRSVSSMRRMNCRRAGARNRG